MSNPTGEALMRAKTERLMADLRASSLNRGIHGKLAAQALEYIEVLRACVDQLSAPARTVIKLAQEEGVYTHALMNAYLKRIEGQTQEIAKLNARVAELEQQIAAQSRSVER